MAVRNVARGGGKAYKAEVLGVKELERKLQALLPDNPALMEDLKSLLSESAAVVRDQMKADAQAAGWSGAKLHTKQGAITGQEAIESIFSSVKPQVSGNRRSRISALAGVSKRRTLAEWNAGKHPKSPRAKVSPGNKVAESLAFMLEIGTSKAPAKPAIRTAVTNAKQKVLDLLTAGYNQLLEKYATE